jgi:serine/threonine protein kinase
LLHGPAVPGFEADVYGAAAVLYELVTGQPPLKRESVRLGRGFAALTRAGVRPVSAGFVNPDLPGELVDLLDLCLTPHAEERPGIAADVLDRLHRIARGLDDRVIPFGDLQRWDDPTGLWSA